jgi:carboxyl-terminal processing protease
MNWKKVWIGSLIVIIAGLGFYSFNRDNKNLKLPKILKYITVYFVN